MNLKYKKLNFYRIRKPNYMDRYFRVSKGCIRATPWNILTMALRQSVRTGCQEGSLPLKGFFTYSL